MQQSSSDAANRDLGGQFERDREPRRAVLDEVDGLAREPGPFHESTG